MSRVRSLYFSLFVLVCSTASYAADDWMLTTSDLRSRIVQLHGIYPSGVSVASAATQPTTINLQEFLSLDRSNSVAVPPAHWIAQLQNGDLLVGDPDSLDGETLRWRESLIGPMSLPLSSVVSLRRSDGARLTTPMQTKPRNLDDVVTLTNGDVLHGVISDLNSKTISVQRTGGSTVAVSIDSVATVEFASTAGSTSKSPEAESAFRITLLDGSTMTGSDIHVEPPAVSLVINGAQQQITLGKVQSIQQLNGPVSWLSDTPPAENVQTPLMGASFPARFDQNQSGEPLRFGDRVFLHGTSVHAYSRLSWPIDSRDQAFRTQFAIDGDAPYANVTVRIKLDGQVVSETRDVRAGKLFPVTVLDVRDKHTLTLEVEDDSNDDVQARLNWLEPALLRRMPEAINESASQP